MQRNLIVIVGIFAIAGIASADQGRTEIGPTDTFPIIIDTPGSYVLTADLHVTAAGVNAIEITAENVDIDLGGHVIRGPGVSSDLGVGIYSTGVYAVTIHNGSITEISEGIKIVGTAGISGANRFFDLTLSHCGTRGLKFTDGIARDIVVADIGSVGVDCTRCSISNVTVGRSSFGIIVFHGTAENCTATYNSDIGIYLERATLTRGTAISNGGHGIAAYSGSVVMASTVSFNQGEGIHFNSNGNNNAINCAGHSNVGGNIVGCADGNGCHQNYLP